ncbi:MAG TPA: hypothetical protein PLV93_09975 [Microthrixaceae bacterium]|nr:hypothetical protein [Microthrixaceae bacterium]HNI35716.1 hypothetical protein [Microthrixaceae bacterium]
MTDPSDSRNAPRARRRDRFRSLRPAASIDRPEGSDALRNGAVFTDSRVEIEIDDETGLPRLRIVSGARPRQ